MRILRSETTLMFQIRIPFKNMYPCFCQLRTVFCQMLQLSLQVRPRGQQELLGVAVSVLIHMVEKHGQSLRLRLLRLLKTRANILIRVKPNKFRVWSFRLIVMILLIITLEKRKKKKGPRGKDRDDDLITFKDGPRGDYQCRLCGKTISPVTHPMSKDLEQTALNHVRYDRSKGLKKQVVR